MKVRLLALGFGFCLVAGVAYAGPTPGGADTDNDGVEDSFDNCTTISNPTQTDTDHNGCGNACTCIGTPLTCNQATVGLLCDGDGDTTVSGTDYGLLSAQWECNQGANPPCPSVNSMDCDGDTTVSGTDYGILSTEWENVVGPSGITTAQCNPATCQCTPQ